MSNRWRGGVSLVNTGKPSPQEVSPEKNFPDTRGGRVQYTPRESSLPIPEKISDTERQGFDVSALDRFRAGLSEVGKIYTNVQEYVRSVHPLLMGRLGWKDGGLTYISPDEDYGEGFMVASPQERRDMMKKNKEERSLRINENINKEREAMAQRDEWDIAGLAGEITGIMIDPLAAVLLPVKGAQAYRAAKGISRIKKGAAMGAKGGAKFGAAYGASEHMVDEGLPTNIKEATSFAADTAIASGFGLIGGGILMGGVGAYRPAVEGSKRMMTNIALKNPTRSAKIADAYESIMAENILNGQSTSVAAKNARNILKITKHDVRNLVKQHRPDGRFKTPSPRNKLEAVNARTTLKAQAYQDALDAARAEGLSVRAASAKAREGLGLHVRDLNTLRRMTEGGKFVVREAEEAAAALTARRIISMGGTSAVNAPRSWVDNLIEPMYEGISKIAPRVGKLLRDMEAGIYIRSHEAHDQVVRFNYLYRKLNNTDKLEVAMSLTNGEVERAAAVFNRVHGKKGTKETIKMRATLDQVAKDLKSVGLKFDTLDNFFPRVVKDVTGLKAYLASLGKNVEGDILKAAADKGSNLNGAEINKILNKIVNETGASAKAKASQIRKITKLNREMYRFYEDPISALDLYIRDSYSTVARRNFFGKHLKQNENQVENMGNSIKELLGSMKLTPEQNKQLTELLHSRFVGGEQAGSVQLNNLRSLMGGVTLGNPLSAAVQLGDIGPVAFTKGVLNTLKSLPRSAIETVLGASGRKTKFNVNADTLGLMRDVVQELQTGGYASTKIRRITDNLFKYGGFKLIDRFGKNTAIVASRNRAQALARTPRGVNKLIDELGKAGWDGTEISTLIRDLKLGKTTDITKQYLFSQLSDLQPISKSEMPAAYLNVPNGRMFYQFHTWSLKQIALTRKHIFADLFSSDPVRIAKGVKNLTMFALIVGNTQMAAREVRGFLAGKPSKLDDPSKVPIEFTWGVMANFGFNKFGLDESIKSGDITNLVGFGAPSISIASKIGRDAGKAVLLQDRKALESLLFRDTGLGRFVSQWFIEGEEGGSPQIQAGKGSMGGTKGTISERNVRVK